MERDDLPVVKKCCFCFPLRYCLLTWGYVKLAFAILLLKFFIGCVIILSFFVNLNKDVPTILVIILISVMLVAEISLHILFIIGGHKKSVKMLQAYYYYAIFTWIVALVICLAATGLLLFNVIYDQGSRSTNANIICIALGFFICIVVQTFLVLSLRSEIIKLRSTCPYQYVKNDNDPEGTINAVKDEKGILKENEKVRIL